MNKQRMILALVLVTSAVATGSAQAAQPAQPGSVLALFNRVPELPVTADDAAKWVSKNGAVIHPGLLALKGDIEAHKRAMETVGQAGAASAQAQSANTMQDMSKGMADVGIDMERAQRDPAYAKEVQERMKKMSPAELMAMSQKMSKPMNQDKRLQNQAQAMVNDPPAVKAAAEAGYTYSSGQMTRLQVYQTHWQETEQAVQKINAKRLIAPLKKPDIEADSPGCNNSCQAQWDAYASKMLPLMVARDTEILDVRRAALQRQRAGALEGVKAADKNLLAAQYGAASQSQANKLRIMGY
ncbi:MAG TPA: hypothetical protein VGO53_12065, partial [Steroidobacteraceae bacterium]|nr:hypothetical protein [Steroidobacteraceae bacterium]